MHRAPPTRFLAFITLWSIFVYYPVARWSWDHDGWSNRLGVMDFAGGTPVHIVSGTTVATFAMFCGIEERRKSKKALKYMGRFFNKLYKRLKHPWYELWLNLLSVVGFCAVRCFGRPATENGNVGSDPDDSDSDDEDDDGDEPEAEPYNINYVILGTSMLVSTDMDYSQCPSMATHELTPSH